jgi:hypothetical protein
VAVLSMPVERIRSEARALDPAKVALTLVFLAPFLLGWLLGALWSAVAWMWTAGAVGFRSAPGRRVRPDEGASG